MNFGSQYRSAAFYSDEEEQKELESFRDELQKKLNRPVTTEIAPLKQFWRAEEYHQQYYAKRNVGSCRI